MSGLHSRAAAPSGPWRISTDCSFTREAMSSFGLSQPWRAKMWRASSALRS
jgi:hypothetical protein